MKSIDDMIIDKLTKGKGLNIKSIDTMITEKVSSVSAKGWESLKSTISGKKDKKDEQKEEKKEKKEDQQNKKVVDELVLSNDILVDISENTQLLHKAFDDLAKELRQTIKSNGGNANARANSTKGVLPTKDNRKGFEEKEKIQRAIVGEKNPLVPVVLSIKGDTRKIVELLENGNFGKDNKKSDFDWKSLLPLLPLLGGILAPEMASVGRAILNGIPTALKIAQKVATTGAKTGASVAETVAKNADTAAKAGASVAETAAKNSDALIKGATTAAKAGAKAAEAVKDVTDSSSGKTSLATKAKNAVVGEQKLGTMGKVGVGLGIGGTIGRATSGDTNGAIAEGISTALPVIFGKTKFGKLANLASIGIDGGLIARDLSKDKNVPKEEKKEEEQVKKEDDSGSSSGGTLGKIASNTAETNQLLKILIAKGGIGSGGGGNGTDGGNGGEQLPEPQQQSNSTAGLLAGVGVLGLGGALLAKKTGGLSNVIAKKVAPTVAKPIIKPNTVLTPVAKKTVMTAPPKVAPKVATNTVSKVGAKAVAKGAVKTAGKLIPGVGLVMGAMGAYDKASQGDYTGALIEGASGVASLIPGVGTAVSAGLTGLSVARDVHNETGDTEAAVGSGVGATALMGGALLASKGVGKVLTKAPDKLAGTTGKLSSAVSNSSKSIADNAIASGKTIGSSVKDMHGKLANTSKILTNTGTALKTNVEKMFTNVNGQLLKNIAKLGAVGVVGAGIASSTGSGGSSIGMIGTLGSVSSKYETGGRGVGTVSTGKGDHGGVSYGKHQMTANTMNSFLKSDQGKQWAGHFKGLKAGTKEFSDKYKQVAAQHGSAFEASQKSYIDVNYFGSAAKSIKSKIGLDVVSRGRAVQELVYSTAVQYGPSKCVEIFTTVLGKNAARMSDAEIINKIQDYKAKNVNTHFKSSSADVKKGISNRIENERKDLITMNNTAGTRTVGANQQAPSATGGGSVKSASSGSGTSSGSSTASSGTSSGSSKDNSKASSADFDLDKICATAVSRAKAKSMKKCAEYVRVALQAGDNKKRIKGGMSNANEWNVSLPKIGFTPVGQASPQKGDVAHMPPNKFSKYGHVCIWTGDKWVSDFVQNKMSPYSEEVPYTIYRAKSGYTNGSAVAAGEGVDGANTDAEGYDGGSEGQEDESTDGVLKKAGDILSNGVADIFNSEAMDSVRKFMKGDISKRGDDTPYAVAQGDFTKSLDELDEARQLKGAGNNGEKDNLDGVLGTDTELLRQKRHDNYDPVYAQITGTTDIQRQLRHEDYGKVKDAMGGTSNIQRQVGGRKSKWWHGLFDSTFGGNNLLSGIFGLATGQKKLSDLTPDEIGGMIDGGADLLNGGWKKAIGKTLGLDASSSLEQMAGGGIGGALGTNLVAPTASNTTATSESVNYTTDGSMPSMGNSPIKINEDGTMIVTQGGRTVHMNADGTVKSIVNTNPPLKNVQSKASNVQQSIPNVSTSQQPTGLGGSLGDIAKLTLGDKLGAEGTDIVSKGLGTIFGDGTMTDKANGVVGMLSGGLQNEAIGNVLGKKLGISDDMANMAMSGLGGLIGGIKFVPKKTGESVKISDSQVNYDPTESNMEDNQMQMAKHFKEESDAKKFDVKVNVPPPVKTPTGSDNRGKTTQDGLGGAISVKNPDTIIHTVAVTMMANSV